MLDELRLQDFRCHPAWSGAFAPALTTLTGPNGAGKTAILEAIHFTGRLRSFRTAQTRDLIRRGAGQFGIHAATRAGPAFRVLWSAQARSLQIDGVPVPRAADFWGRLPCVAFTSHDVLLASGPSSERRTFLNALLSQIHRPFLHQLLRYNTILRQRNALLAGRIPFDPNLFHTLSDQLLATGSPLQTQRLRIARLVQRFARPLHRHLTASADPLHLTIHPAPWHPDLPRERDAKTSLIGFHRDRIDTLLAGRSTQRFASEGQQRAAAIALRAASVLIMARRAPSPPTLLIDDIFGELDPDRRARLLDWIPSGLQTIVTCTDDTWIRARSGPLHSLRLP